MTFRTQNNKRLLLQESNNVCTITITDNNKYDENTLTILVTTDNTKNEANTLQL